jgi:hypothetical protein
MAQQRFRGKARTRGILTSESAAVTNLAEYGILGVQRNRNGVIRKVRHVTFGLISVQTYGQLRMLKAAKPIILEVIHGGYQLKAWIWGSGFSLDVFASGVTIPFGVLFVLLALALALADELAGNALMATLDILALALPFGEVYLLVRLGATILQMAEGSASSFATAVESGNPQAIIQSLPNSAGTAFSTWIANALSNLDWPSVPTPKP